MSFTAVIIAFLFFEGGTFKFRDEDVTLNAENILIVDGGIFQVKL